MNEFVSNFWSIAIIAICILSVVFLAFLLWFTANIKTHTADDGSTGHVWDEDLREMNNPLPIWWLKLFIISMVVAVIYAVAYLSVGEFNAQFKWSSTEELDKEVAKAKLDLAPIYAAFDAQTAEQLALDPKAMAVGDRLFANNCSQCHGYDARGSKGFPNLTDNDWLHGGTPEKIKETLTQGRIGQMPPMAAAVGGTEEIRNVSHYVLSLSGSPHDSVRAALGKSSFAVCAACHGQDGKGMQAVGAPNLTDKIWLHGWGEAAITAMINNGKVNQMPAQHPRLTESQIHVLTAYVWGMSNTKSN